MRNELHIFFAALMFYTRIPCPRWVKYSGDYLGKSIRHLPLIGVLVGAVTALVLIAGMCIFPTVIAVLLSTLFGIAITGSFHEDGLADVCDGFGGGNGKAQILEIMKDSRVGTYGVMGLFFVLSLKIAALVTLVEFSPPPHLRSGSFILLLLVSGHSLSRFAALTTLTSHQYVRADKQAKAKPALKNKLRWRDASTLYALVLGIGPLFLFFTPWMAIPVLCVVLTKWWLCRFFEKRIGGYTGDCLGAIQQASELVFYLGIIGVWKYI